MAPLIFLFAGLAICGAGLARWTRWHPLLIGTGLALLTILPAMLVFGAAMSPAAAPAAAVLGIIAAAPASIGAFGGWLMRKHKETR